jgi:hypothetical protein
MVGIMTTIEVTLSSLKDHLGWSTGKLSEFSWSPQTHGGFPGENRKSNFSLQSYV